MIEVQDCDSCNAQGEVDEVSTNCATYTLDWDGGTSKQCVECGGTGRVMIEDPREGGISYRKHGDEE